MRNKITEGLLALLMVVGMTSCLGGSDHDEYTYYSDAAITSFTLGTMNKYLTNSEGTITKSTFSGSTYKFNIDQEQGLIFNTDSLPYGTDATHVVTSIGTLNSGTVFIKNIDDDEYNYYVSTDSMDLSVERKLRVLAQDGKQYREYTLKLNVHQEDGEAFAWKSALGTDDDGNALANADFTALSGMKAIALGDNIYLFGSNGSETLIYTTNKNDGKNWSLCSPNVTLPADAYKTMVSAFQFMYVLNGETLLESWNGMTWGTAAENTGLRQLIGAAEGCLFALSTSGKFMVSNDCGETWTADQTESGNDASMPVVVEGYSYVSLKTNSDMGQIAVIGKDASGNTVVWTKLTEYRKPLAYPWTLVEGTKETPQLASISAFGYDNSIMMLGLKDGKATTYNVSKDIGINWSASSKYTLPTPLTTNVYTTTVDGNNFIWLFYGDSGQVWRGRLNRLGWERQ